jgi:hypothetical protein
MQMNEPTRLGKRKRAQKHRLDDRVRLGSGSGIALSPDGRWALAVRPSDPTKLLMLPTGAGETRQAGTSRFRDVNAGWFSRSKAASSSLPSLQTRVASRRQHTCKTSAGENRVA